MSPREWGTLAAFTVALVLWTLPDLAGLLLGTESTAAEWLHSHVTLAVGAVTGAALLFILRPGGQPVLTWTEARAIDWGTIVLFGGGIALGSAMEASGLAASLGEALAEWLNADTVWAITALGIAAAILLSEIASNTASASIMVPVVIGLAQAVGVDPVAPALGAALGASLGFMMPVSTPPNAIVYGSGLVPAREMRTTGLLIDAAGFLVTFGGLRLILPLMGLA
jgi:sodium-dependent dicarboxylate transporter 2/3/5